MPENKLLQCAMTIGVDRRIAQLIVDCDQAISTFADGRDPRWLGRIEDQRRRLVEPDLRTLVAVTTQVCEETPALAPFVTPILAELSLTNPDLRPFHHRLSALAKGEDSSGLSRKAW